MGRSRHLESEGECMRVWWSGRVEVGEWCGDVEVAGRDEGR